MQTFIHYTTALGVLFFAQSFTNAQTNNCLTASLVNDFVTTQQKKDTSSLKGLLLDSISISVDYYYDLIELNKGLDTSFFSRADISHLACQAKLAVQYSSWNDILKNKKLIITDEVVEKEIIENDWESYRGKYSAGFYTYSIPLFSLDEKKAIMIKKYTCGPFCGFTKVLLFVKENSEWTVCWEKIKGKK